MKNESIITVYARVDAIRDRIRYWQFTGCDVPAELQKLKSERRKLKVMRDAVHKEEANAQS